MNTELLIQLKQTDQGKALLPNEIPEIANFREGELQMTLLMIGDNIRFGNTPDYPWLVVSRQCCNPNDVRSTLTIWLDSPAC